ncbi:MAG TPA: Rv3235 family protein [Amycolatopsis sp.]|nr:Rv3235 family protein [Amycolatopsis sp.]
MSAVKTLQQLSAYEPQHDGPRPLETTGPPASDTRPDPPGDQPFTLRQVRAVLNLILEVRTGHRPAGRLRALVTPGLYRMLGEQPQDATPRYTLKTVHGCRVAPDAVEASGTAHSQGRAYAVVARFERATHGWRCTFFELIRPDGTRSDTARPRSR